MHVWALRLSCETPAAPPDRAAGGSHTTARELQTCTFEGPGASNTTKIPRKKPKEREKRIKTVAGEGKKSAKFWAATLRGPTLRGPQLRGPHFFWVRGPTMTPKMLAQIGLAKNWIGQNWLWPKPRWPKMDWPKLDWPKLVKSGWPKRDWPKSVPS